MKVNENVKRYNVYSEYMKNKYGEKVYKLPVNLPVTCPNRDGNCGSGGCSFCSDIGAGFENLDKSINIKDQLLMNMEKISKKYKAKKFTAFFNNYSNTYMDTEVFRGYMQSACIENIVELTVSTRPDCISYEHLEVLKEVSEKNGVSVVIELGLQSVNHNTLKKVNRGHSLAEFVDAVMMIKEYGFDICAHLITNLPWDTRGDIIEAAKLMSALRIKQIKLHSLYILKGTEMGKQYEEGEFEICSPEEYISRVVDFISYSSPNIIYQRFAGRAPKEETLFCNWGMSWWKLKDLIDERLENEDITQGCLCDYLGGKAIRNQKK